MGVLVIPGIGRPSFCWVDKVAQFGIIAIFVKTTEHMSALPQDWSREDFLALALHYAANADLEITAEERDYMRQLCGEAHCQKAAAYDDQHSDYEVLETLMAMKERFFPAQEGSEELKAHLAGLFRADDDYSHLEHNMMRGMERIW